jgi:hypothetical protein
MSIIIKTNKLVQPTWLSSTLPMDKRILHLVVRIRMEITMGIHINIAAAFSLLQDRSLEETQIIRMQILTKF